MAASADLLYVDIVYYSGAVIDSQAIRPPPTIALFMPWALEKLRHISRY
jgi:hypothetical protein